MINSHIHVLVLEESDDDFQSISSELNRSDYKFQIKRAINEYDFETCIENRVPDVVLSEFTIKSYNIQHVIRALKNKNYSGPLILVTDKLDDEEAVDLLSNSVIDDYVLKENLTRLRFMLRKEHKNSLIQRELKERNRELENLSLIASHTHNGVIITGKNKKVEWVNKAFTKISGYTLGELTGKSPGVILQGKDTDPKAVSRISKKLSMNIPFSEEILNYHKNGSAYVVKLDITPVLDEVGEIVKYIAIQENVTKRIKTEKALLNSNKRFLEAQRVAKMGDWSYDLEKNILNWSPQMYRIFDRERSLGPPSFQEFIDMTELNGRNDIKEAVLYTLKTRTAYDLQIEINVSENKHLRATGTPKVDDDGKIEKLTGIVQDITELKQVEEDLKEKSDQLDHIISNLNSTILRFVLYPNGQSELLFISDNMVDLYEIPKADALNDVNTIFNRVHKEDLNALNASIAESADKLTAWDHTWRQLMKDGRVKYLSGRGMPEKQNGSVIWDSIILDETQHVIEEKRKKELENLLTTSLDEIFIFDAKSLKFIYCNNSALSNIGYTMGEIEQLTPLEIKPGISKKAFNNILEQTRSESGFRFETIHERKNSSTYHVLINLKFARYLGQDVYVAHTQDISNIKDAEEKLNKFKARTELAVEGAEVGIWELNLETMDTYFNELYYRMLGYSEKDVTFNKSFHDDIIHPDDALTIEGHMEMIFMDQIDGFEETIRMKHKNGEYRWILDKARIIERDDNNEPLILAGTHLDITEIVKTVEEKNVLIQEVHHRVKNNLAIISGLIDLQMINNGNMEDQSLLDTQKRINAIASVHEQLYQTDNFSEIVIDDYFKSLIDKIKDTFFEEDHSVTIDFNCSVKAININQAVPLGLLLNELITNSVKYRLNDNKVSIAIQISETDEGTISFYYEGSGPGIDGEIVDLNEKFGFDLIQTLISQLSDEHNLETQELFKLQFDFKKKKVGAYSNLKNPIK